MCLVCGTLIDDQGEDEHRQHVDDTQNTDRTKSFDDKYFLVKNVGTKGNAKTGHTHQKLTLMF